VGEVTDTLHLAGVGPATVWLDVEPHPLATVIAIVSTAVPHSQRAHART
jgi:hypothetical protein